MRIHRIVVVSILLCFSSLAWAGNEVKEDPITAQNKELIKQQKERINELRKLLELSDKQNSEEKSSMRPLVVPNNADRKEALQKQPSAKRSQEYFDLTDISVVCFMRNDRPVCGRNGSR